ncbi:cyclin-like protein [Cokeromyces recurvatus]|uniref:cyclin-like protein n=1 Tax=Cokeromyces recurvatus TaxID=90255 RepID=UPI00221FD246|nr:cyclin-like protein [Cokeromyces recurvatus]KAI7903362.1 cyclin-like protein [Cokeromyces recurvatus]
MEENQWILEREESQQFPSVLHGMKYEEELATRLRAICMIECVGNRLELPPYAIASACTLFHRFYTRRSFFDYNGAKIAQACIFVACKSEESARRPQDIARSWLYTPDEIVEDEKIEAFVVDLLYYEYIVLEITCFDLQIDHPYCDLFHFADETFALAYINDSYRLPMCLWYVPRAIAAAALIMAFQGQDLEFPLDPETLWGQFLIENGSIIGGKCIR